MTLEEVLNAARQAIERGDARSAEAICRQVLQNVPNEPQSLDLLGLIALRRGANDEAARLYEAAIASAPLVPGLHVNLAHALRGLGEFDRAEARYARAIELDPADYRAHDGLGICHATAQRLEAARASFLRAIELRPDFADALNNLGALYFETGESALAVASLRRALELNSRQAGAWLNLGNALAQQHKPADAEAAFRRAIELEPRSPQATVALAGLLRTLGRIPEATAALREPLERNPPAASWAAAHSMLLFTLNFDASLSPVAVFREHLRFGEIYEQPYVGAARSPRIARHNRLRLGFVSADFREHAVAYFLHPLLRELDRERFEIYCYSAVRGDDAWTARFRGLADHWRDIANVNDDAAAEKIREDRIDALVDLGGHATHSRLMIFPRKPAPVQITWLGYLGTTGLRAMDCRLADPHLESPDSAAWFTERALMMPRTYWCYEPPADAPEVAPPPRDSSGQVTFGCLNHQAKLGEHVLVTWAKLLDRAPGSRLLLHAKFADSHERIARPLLDGGIARERIEFVGTQPRREYLQTYSRIDVALDPFPYGGGTTTCEALWMGVPVVTLAGQTPFARTGASILSNAGLPELIATSPGDYIDRALAAAEKAAEYRQSMRERLQQSPLTDAKAFAEAFARAVRGAFS